MTAYTYNVQRQPLARLARGLHTFIGDVAGGCVVITHSGLALLGVAVAVAIVLIASQPGLRHQAGTRLATWLDERRGPPEAPPAPMPVAVATSAPTPTPVKVEQQMAVSRATATDPQTLPREQARLTLWISHRYQVAPEPVAALVAGAYKAGQSSHIDPTLILAVMAVESSFNPFAQSTAGAQGLMQVMTRVHGEKYDDYGGNYAAFDPLSNLSVGVWVLRDCIDSAGSTAGGLRCYVGATHLKTDGGYVNKVMTEYARLEQVVGQGGGRSNTTVNDNAATTSLPVPSQTAQAVSRPRANPVAVVAALWPR